MWCQLYSNLLAVAYPASPQGKVKKKLVTGEECIWGVVVEFLVRTGKNPIFFFFETFLTFSGKLGLPATFSKNLRNNKIPPPKNPRYKKSVILLSTLLLLLNLTDCLDIMFRHP